MDQQNDQEIKDEIMNSAPTQLGVIASGPVPEKKPNFFKTKSGKILLAVIGGIIIFGAGIGTTLILTSSNNSNTAANKSSSDEKSEEQSKDTAKKNTAKSDNSNSEDSKESSKEIASNTATIKPIDLSKPINGRSGVTYTDASEGGDADWNGGWTVAISGDGTSATLTGDGQKLARYVDDWSGPGGTWSVTGFSGKIKQAIIGEFGQAIAPPLPAFYLMEDGTVEYNPILKWMSGPRGNVIGIHDEFKSQGKVSGVDGVVKLYTAYMDTGWTGGGRTTLAAKADGSFYDLGQLLGL